MGRYLVSWPRLIVIPLSLIIAPMVLVSLTIWNWVTLFCFSYHHFCTQLYNMYNIFLFIPELSHNLDTIIWHLSWLTLVSQLTNRVAALSHWQIKVGQAGKIQYQARCMEIEGTKAGLNLNYFNWTPSIELLIVNNFKLTLKLL